MNADKHGCLRGVPSVFIRVYPWLLSGFLLVAAARAEEAGMISGRVLGPDGAGVVGVPVSVINTESKLSTLSESGEAGAYAVTGLVAGSYIVQASGDDQNYLARKNIRVEAGGETGDVDLKSGGLVLSGRAAQRSGVWVEGAFITATKTDFGEGEFLPTASLRTANSDPEGNYRVAGLLPGRYSVTVAGPGLGILLLTNFLIEADTKHDFVFEDTCVVSGRVVGPDGEGVKDAQMQAFRVEPSPMIRCFALTGDEGRFAVQRLGPGRYEVIAMGAGYQAAVKTGIEAVAGASNDIGDMAITAGGGTVTGHVMYGPLPLPAIIVLRSATSSLEYMTQADEHGEYKFEMVPAGNYLINFSDPTGDPAPVTVVDGGKTVHDYSYYSPH